MNDLRQAHLSVDYNQLRTCERLALSEAQFLALPYESQLRLLAYNQLRMLEESASAPPGQHG